MKAIDSTTPAGTEVKVNSTRGWATATLVRLNDDGTATVRSNGKNRKVRAANVKTECAALIPTHQGGCGCGYVSIG